MRLYSYVVARDYGFAPNPFYGNCTLATCKPMLRRKVSVGDWVIGTGSAPNGLTGHLVYAMKVTETMSFDCYFADPRFHEKKPNLAGSLKQMFGDNIYSRDPAGEWQQLDSHHSLQDGSPNPANITNDTNPNRLLLSDHFAYFGDAAPKIPPDVRIHNGQDICALRHYRVNFSPEHMARFVDWFEGLGVFGPNGTPREWLKNGAMRRGGLAPSASNVTVACSRTEHAPCSRVRMTVSILVDVDVLGGVLVGKVRKTGRAVTA